MSTANPFLSGAHRAAYDLANDFSLHLLPRTGAYHEIWLDGEKVEDASRPAGESEEPIYGVHYLPRKFKTVVAVPPHNDVDVYAQDLAFIAIVENGKIAGYNVTIGGGMGMTHGEPNTFPRLADMLGFCTPEQAVDVGEKIVTVQRDWGNREDRKRARLKYTLEDRGLDAFRDEVERRLGYKLGAARPFKFERTGDAIGWQRGADKKWHLTLFIENGRIKDQPGHELRTALRKIAEIHKGSFILTNNQNLIIAEIPAQATAQDRGDPGRARRDDGDDLRPAPQQHGVRGAANLRAGAGRERAVPAGAHHQHRGGGRPRRADGGRHRHPHDRVPQRLRPAVRGGDRPRRPIARTLQSLSRRRVRRLAAEQALRAATSTSTASSRRWSRCCCAMPRSATGPSVSAIS